MGVKVRHTRTPSVIPVWADSVLEDEFLHGSVTSGQIGSLGWAGAGTITTQGGGTGVPGFYRFDTGASSGTAARINMAVSGSFDPAARHACRWRIRLNTNDANTTMRIGAANSVAGAPPNNGIYFEKLDADTTWFAVTRLASVETRFNTLISVDTSFHSFEYVRDGSGVLFLIDNVPVGTQTLTIPTTVIAQYAYIINSAAASKTFDVDKARFLMSGIAR